MSKSVSNKRCVVARSSCGSSMIENLESRCLFSASPIHLSPVTPMKILAPATGYEKVTIHNLTADVVTEPVTITLAPSLDGVNPDGSYSSSPVSETITLKKHGSLTIKVPFTPPITLPEGKTYTIATVDLNGTTITATAPGGYKLTTPPVPTLTPSLVGHFVGECVGSEPVGSGGAVTHDFSFEWQTTSQTLTSLTGTIFIGDQQTTGTMTGQENTNGTCTYTIASPLINFTLTGAVTDPSAPVITGRIKGTLVDNLFKKLFGRFMLTFDPS